MKCTDICFGQMQSLIRPNAVLVSLDLEILHWLVAHSAFAGFLINDRVSNCLATMQVELKSAKEEVPLKLQVSIPEGKPGGALGAVLERSRQLSLMRYNKPLYDEESYKDYLAAPRQPVILNRRQEAVLAGSFAPINHHEEAALANFSSSFERNCALLRCQGPQTILLIVATSNSELPNSLQ